MIYVHVPFCRSFCTYCGFYSELCSRKDPQQVQNRLFEDYADALCAEIAARQAEICTIRCPENDSQISFSPDTLYMGGGTPSALPLAVLERIVRALGPADYEEFTVEVNPDDVVAGGPEYVDGLRGLGVNRVSMGVQSFDDGILRWMNRRHDAAGAREAFRLLRAGGFDNVSVDLIFGLSQLSDDQWRDTVSEALALRPEHISAYQLSVEEDSALERMIKDGRYAEASDEQCRAQYDALCRMLSEAGYVHYEISNWALPGREAVHNSAYWRRVPYVGLGPGAHSFASAPDSGGVRSWNSQELARRDGDGRLQRWSSGQEVLSPREAAEETVMLGLRTAAGLPLGLLRSLAPAAPLDALISQGALSLSSDTADSFPGPRLRIPEDHFFVSDDIISLLLP